MGGGQIFARLIPSPFTEDRIRLDPGGRDSKQEFKSKERVQTRL